MPKHQEYQESRSPVSLRPFVGLLRFASLNLLATFSVAPLVYAAPPTPFDNWSQAGGAISATCPSGFTCTVSVDDEGILQRTLVAPDGQEYIQLILSGDDAMSGSMSTESFVGMNGAADGISLLQSFSQVSGGTDISGTVQLNTGWANGGGPAVQIDQALIDDYQGVGYESTFALSVDQDANGNATGSYVDVLQRLTNSTALDPNVTATGQDVQTFVHRRASGSRVPSNGSATLPAVQGGQGGMMGGGGMGDGMMGGGAGGTITWQAGDTVQVTWIGMLCEGCQQPQDGGMGGGGMGGGGMGGGTNATFSYQSFDNLADAADPIATASIISTNPFDWPDPPFGTQPSL